VGAGAGAQAQSQQTPENAFVKKLSTAADEAAQGDIALALRDFRAAIAIDPRQSEGWYALGSMLGQTGDFQGAESALRRAIELKPNLAKAHYSLALTLIGNPQGKMDWAGAITECREALKYRPEYPQALNLLGAGLAATGQADEAIQVLQHAIQLLPDSTEAHFTLGTVLESRARLDEALTEYQAAIAAKGSHPEATAALGNLLFRMGKTAEAKKQLNEALRINPDLTGAHYTLARILAGLGQKSEAKVEFAETKDLTDRPANGIQSSQLSNQGLELAAKGDLNGAAVILRKAIVLKPDYGLPHYNLGLILADLGDLPGAQRELEKAISLSPGQSKPWLEYGRILKLAGNRNRAAESIAWAATLSPSDTSIRSELAATQTEVSSTEDIQRQPDVGAKSDTAQEHLKFALELMKQSDFQGAVGELLRALALQPGAVEPRRRLAEAFDQIGDDSHSALEYYKLLRCAPEDVNSRIALGNILLSQGNFEQAKEQFRIVLREAPGSSEAKTTLDKLENPSSKP
jgi:tetratricopeptide (TPR) repeat protein